MCDHPVDRMHDALHALQGLRDLLLQLQAKDMHLIDPDHLFYLLDIPLRQACEAYQDIKQVV